MAFKGYSYTFPITDLSLWTTVPFEQKQVVFKNIQEDFVNKISSNPEILVGIGIPRGTKLVGIGEYYGNGAWYFKSDTGNLYISFHFPDISNFENYNYSGVVGRCGWLWLQSGYRNQLQGLNVITLCNITVPTVTLPGISDPELVEPITKYLQFMQKSSLYNSFVKNVNAELVKKQSVQVITDFIYSIFKDLKDGMVIFDYYQWSGETDDQNYELRMYKQFYIRVFGISAGSLVQKSFQIDHNLFSGIAGANLLDNGILINNDGITEKVGSGLNSYQRKGYIIHANNCNLESFIQKLQEDSAYTLETLEFPDYDSLQEKIQQNKDYLTKDGKTAQQIYDEKYAEKYSYYQRFKDILGLTDADCAAYANEAATAYTNDYIKTLNDTIATEAAVQSGMIAEQEYQQSQASQTVEQAKAEAEAQKESDAKAEELEKAKVRSKEVKQKVIDYEAKYHQLYNKYSKTTRTKLELGLNMYVGDITATGYRAFYHYIPVSEVKQ